MNNRKQSTGRIWIVLALVLVGSRFGAAAAARSVHVVIKNNSTQTLQFISISADHGIVTRKPSTSIPPSGTGELFAESNGVATGTEGRVRYRVGTGGPAVFHWDNPFVGNNSADGTAPSGFAVSRIGDTGNRTLIFFSIHAANQATALCNPDWVIAHLGRHAEPGLDDFDKGVGFLSTPFKRLGISGWVDTGCDATAEGIVVRDAQHSTDDFWTIDVRLTQFTIAGKSLAQGPVRFVRIEVEPKTKAHDRAGAKGKQHIHFDGHVLIDTHHADELIEVHPANPILAAPSK